MKFYQLFSFSILLFLGTTLQAQQAPAAEIIMNQAMARAGAENKNVFLMFHASWCGWCHKLDSSLNDISVKPYFDANYVLAHVVVNETKGKEHLENPGAKEMLIKYGGDRQGIPFFLIFDADGKLLADSKIRTETDSIGKNMGCPAKDEEVEAFLSLLRKTSRITEKQLSLIGIRFKKNG